MCGHFSKKYSGARHGRDEIMPEFGSPQLDSPIQPAINSSLSRFFSNTMHGDGVARRATDQFSGTRLVGRNFKKP